MTSNSKLSVQMSDLYQYPEAAERIAEMQPVAAKVLIGGEQLSKSLLAKLYDDCPNTWIVVRIIAIEGAFNAGNLAIEGPEAMAQRWVSAAMSYAGFFKDKQRTLLEGPFNEFSNWSLSAEFARFEDRRQLLLAGLGYGAVLLNCSVGTPDTEFWKKFAAPMRTARKLGNVIGMHLYFPLYVTDDYKWLAGRFQDLIAFFDTNPDCRCGIMATEGGIDNCYANDPAAKLRISGGHDTSGWQNCESAFQWRGEEFNETWRLSDCFWKQLVDLDWLLSATQEFICYHVFTYERSGAGWDAFDLKKDGVIDRMIERVNPLTNDKRGIRESLVSLDIGTPLPPPPPPPQPPNNEPGPNLLINPSFEGGSHQESANLYRVPDGWDAYWVSFEQGDIHSEIETHPPHVYDGACSARLWQSFSKRLMGLSQEVAVETGATYELEAHALAWATNDAQVGNPSTGSIQVRIGIGDGVVVFLSPWACPMDEYQLFRVQAVAPSSKIGVLLEAQPIDAMQRTDVFFDKVSLRKIKDAPVIVPPADPDTPPLRGRVKAEVKLNFRQDANTSAKIWYVLDGGTSFEVWQSVAYVNKVKKVGAGWICIKIGTKIGFVASSYCDLL